MIVVDTNILVYLLAGSGAPAEQAAELLRRDPEWAAPVLLLSELRNVLVGSVRRGLVAPDDALGMLDDARLVLGDRLLSPAGDAVVRTALELTLSAYDAEFVVAARELGVRLVTKDLQILDSAPEIAVPLAGNPPPA